MHDNDGDTAHIEVLYLPYFEKRDSDKRKD